MSVLGITLLAVYAGSVIGCWVLVFMAIYDRASFDKGLSPGIAGFSFYPVINTVILLTLVFHEIREEG